MDKEMSTATRFNTPTQVTISSSFGGPAMNTRSHAGVSLVASTNHTPTFSPRFTNTQNRYTVMNASHSTSFNSLYSHSVDDLEENIPTLVNQESSQHSTMPRLSLVDIQSHDQNNSRREVRQNQEKTNEPQQDNTKSLVNLVQQMIVRDEKRYQQDREDKREFMEFLERERRDRLAERQDRLDRENRERNDRIAREERESRLANSFHSDSTQSSQGIPSLKMPFFEDNDNIDVFIQQFERIATLQLWPRSEWATRLGTLLKGKAAEAYAQVPMEDACDYDIVKEALYNRFKLSAETYRMKFRSMKKEGNETFSQFVNRLKITLNRWVTLSYSHVNKPKENVLEDIILLEQLYNIVTPELDLFLRQHRPKNIEEAATLADTFAEAKVASRMKAQKGKNNESNRVETNKENKDKDLKQNDHTAKKFACYRCDDPSHLARDCPLKNDSNTKKSQFVNQDADSMYSNKISIEPMSSMSVNSITENDRKFYHPSTIGNKQCLALRDTGSTDSIVDLSWVPEDSKIVGECKVTLANGSQQKVKQVEIVVNTPFFEGNIIAAAIPNASSPFIIGNTVTFTDGKQEEVPVFRDFTLTQVSTRGMKKRDEISNVVESNSRKVIPGTDLTPNEFRNIQKSDTSLFKYFELAKQSDNEKNGVSFILKQDLLYRQFCDKKNNKYSQLVVPSSLTRTVLTIAHETSMAGHMGVRRTLSRVLQSFYWPGVSSTVRKFCRECDVCQRTAPSARTRKVPLGKMPIISEPFSRVAVDITGPIIPAASSGNRYLLVVVDYATRFPEAVPLRNIEASTIADALWNMWTHYGVPNEVLTDRGSQFTSSLMQEVYSLLGIKGLTTTPYHAQGNGLVERFNATLKQMLKKLTIDQPKLWDHYVSAALFAYREVPQESLGFSPFELLFGRRVRGPLSILRDVWTQEEMTETCKTTAQYVFDLRNRIKETCDLAHTNLKSASDRQEKLFNRKTSVRSFEPNDEVLLLLPTHRNKLQLSWKGPFKVIKKVGVCDYVIQVHAHQKLFHANLLKKYYRRMKAAPAAIVIEEEELSCNDPIEPRVIPCKPDTGIMFPTLKAKEGLKDVQISDSRNDFEKRQLEFVISKESRIFTDVPLRCNLEECTLSLEPDTPIYVKQYPLPHSQDQVVKDEVESMLAAGIIERASSPFSSPILLVRKKDHSMRFCTDFRKLNTRLRFDAEPLPDVESLFAKLGKSKYFSKLDLSKGYFQIPLKREDRPKTAFTTPAGQFQFKVMPFGLRTAGAVFSRIMRMVLEPLKSPHIHNFMDDILLATESWDQHLSILKRLLRRLNEVNLSVRPTKCYLGFHELSFLGHKIGHGNLKPEEDKVSKIQEAPRPSNKSQLRSFLGLAGYYRKFVDNYASIALPLTNLTKKGSPDNLPWDESCQKSFETLKGKLSSKPVLILPDSSKTFVLRTDASGKSLGACLMQDKGQGLQPIAFASKKLNSAEQKYSTIEQECYGVVFGIRKFYPYLYGRNFIVETDHHPLQFLDRIRPQSRRLTAWAMELQSHYFTVRSIPGKENVAADYMSRM